VGVVMEAPRHKYLPASQLPGGGVGADLRQAPVESREGGRQ
jgi:hypothetical protein